MTEKQFVSEYVEIIDEKGSGKAVCVFDKEHTVAFEVKDEYVAMELCDLLNELAEENERLKRELYVVETDCKNAKESRNHYSEENEQLRKEHQEMLEKYVLLRLKIGEVLNDE